MAIPHLVSNTFTLEIAIPRHAPPPALLGLNTLSLSLPQHHAGNSSNNSNNKSSFGPSSGSGAGAAPSQLSHLHITDLPAGEVHLVFAAASLDTGLRCGSFLHVSPAVTPKKDAGGRRCVRCRWDAEAEELVFLHGEDDGVEGKKGDGVKEFAYGYLLKLKARDGDGSGTKDDEWTGLTTYLTIGDLDRLVVTSTSSSSSCGTGNVRTWLVSTLSSSSSSSATTPGDDGEGEKPDLCLTPLTLRTTFPPSSVGSERTKHSLDKSWYLSTLIPSSSIPYGQSLLAELTFTFLTASTLGTPIATQQWKDLLALSLRCRSAVADGGKHTYFVALLALLRAQLRYLGFFSPKEEQEEDGSSGAREIFFETDTDINALGTLLVSFGQALRHDGSITQDNEAVEAVRQAYTLLAQDVAAGKMRWDLTSALAPDATARDVAGGKLQRRIVRGVEGFGYKKGFRTGSGSEEDNDEDEDGDDAPVVLDLEGLLEDDDHDHDNDDGE